MIESKDIRNSAEIAEEYLRCLTSTRAPSTVYKYRYVLNKFLSSYTGALKELTPDEVHLWLASYNMKPGAYEAYFTVINRFFGFCLENGYIDRPLVKECWKPRRRKSQSRFLSSSEQAQIRLEAEKEPPRNRVIMEFMMSGCRRAEISNMNVEDVNFNSRTIRIKDRGTYRYIPISEYCTQLIKDYLESRSAILQSPLFINQRGERLTPNGIYTIVKEVGKKAGISTPLTPTCMRRTFVMNGMAIGIDISTIRYMLGLRM